METNYTYKSELSISPRDYSIPRIIADFEDKNTMREKTDTKTYYDRLSQFKFPKGPASPSTRQSCSKSSSTSSSPSSPTNSNRRFSSHTRSSAVSSSSAESIFSSNEMAQFSKKLDFESPRRNSRLDSSEVPVIDLDIISKPLTPRKKVDYKFEFNTDSLDYLQKSRQNKIIEEDEELGEAHKTDGIIMIDFLREDVSERAMSVAEDYNPLDYVKLDRTVWIDGIEERKEDTEINLGED